MRVLAWHFRSGNFQLDAVAKISILASMAPTTTALCDWADTHLPTEAFIERRRRINDELLRSSARLLEQNWAIIARQRGRK